jgi:carbon monoxide dehydrogenase subunit G
MHLLTEKTVHIDRPALAVFAYVSNMEKFAEWFPGVVSIASADALRHGQQGKQYLETVSLPLRGTQKIKLRVSEVRGHHFFATEGQFAPLMPRMEIEIADNGPHSCDLSWRMFSRSESLIVRYAVLPLARRVMDKRAAAGVVALKRLLQDGV